MSSIGTIEVVAGQRWRVRGGFIGAGMELYVVAVKKATVRSTPYVIVHARREGYGERFEEHRLPLDERWSTGLERL